MDTCGSRRLRFIIAFQGHHDHASGGFIRPGYLSFETIALESETMVCFRRAPSAAGEDAFRARGDSVGAHRLTWSAASVRAAVSRRLQSSLPIRSEPFG